jgi:hypothetical protein
LLIKLFPKAEDGTTIINGTIFVDSKGNPVESQATLFKGSLEKYASFGYKFLKFFDEDEAEDKSSRSHCTSDIFPNSKIIGNIHDNKELLEGK